MWECPRVSVASFHQLRLQSRSIAVNNNMALAKPSQLLKSLGFRSMSFGKWGLSTTTGLNILCLSKLVGRLKTKGYAIVTQSLIYLFYLGTSRLIPKQAQTQTMSVFIRDQSLDKSVGVISSQHGQKSLSVNGMRAFIFITVSSVESITLPKYCASQKCLNIHIMFKI